jgi:hypothetical protein
MNSLNSKSLEKVSLMICKTNRAKSPVDVKNPAAFSGSDRASSPIPEGGFISCVMEFFIGRITAGISKSEDMKPYDELIYIIISIRFIIHTLAHELTASDRMNSPPWSHSRQPKHKYLCIILNVSYMDFPSFSRRGGRAS